ncbi:cytochrome d ubiquinol oxidase subunit II [Mumia zhuanghuii]|uniref:cytochrome d ubiquinol oxidase subunit II n=1 Tax=Mumia zhuanghuii TaxID=2585211 RepID=UPI00226448C2|nr:cytochrome d ubiquinol oxidase subunit II [Mumia zhuanghuii]
MLVGLVTGAVVLAALVPLQDEAPTLSEGLRGRAAPLVAVSAFGGAATLVLLLRRRYTLARVTAVLAVAAVLLGWGVAQYPWILVDEASIDEAAGAPTTLKALLVAVGLAVVLVVPPLAYLYRFTQTEPAPQEEGVGRAPEGYPRQ